MARNFTGKFAVVNRTAKVAAAAERQARKRVGQAAAHLATQTKRTLAGNRTGRRYRLPAPPGGRRRRRAYYTASAPGEPPAQRFGGLRASITASEGKTGANDITFARFGSAGLKPPYGLYLETRKDKRLRRAFLRPTRKREDRKVRAILESGWGEALRNG